MTAQEIAQSFESFAIDHKPEGWPAVQQKELSEAAAMLRKQAEAIKTLREAAASLLWYTDQLEQIVYAPEEPIEVHDTVAGMEAALAATEKLA